MAPINSLAEKRALEAISLKSFKELNLQIVKEKLKIMLDEIGRNGLFSEYTMHNISHVDGMLGLLEQIVPNNVKYIMTPTDWMMTVLSVYFHDLGMLITNDEYDKRYSNEEFKSYLKTVPEIKKVEGVDYEKVMYQDFVRKHHGDRIHNWIANIGIHVDESQPVQKFLYDMLHGLDQKILRDLAQLCKSHQEDLKQTCDKYLVDNQYEQDNKSCCNLLYVAVLLRTADLLHVNSERTPAEKYLLISPQDPYSKREWVKQKSINCIRPRKEKDRDGSINDELEQHCFEIVGEFNDEDAYSHFQLYLDYAEHELKTIYQICKESQRKNNNGYTFPWDEIDRGRIKTVGFCENKLQFNLDKENILNLLIGHTLYNHTNVVLRELTQNALDAVRLMNSISKEGDENQAKVEISWDSITRILTVSDNGTGMNEDVILNYLFKVGASFYRSEQFKKNHPDYHSISRFGIGLLTCFMISDEIDIVTLHYTEKECHSIKIRNYNGQYYMRNDEKPTSIIGQKHGTTFTLKVRETAQMVDIEKDLKQWIFVPEAEVTLKIDDKKVNIGYTSEKAALESFLTTCGLKVDNDNLKIDIANKGCATILTLFKKSSFYNIWQPAYLADLHGYEQSPIGIYLEGIQIEANSPGLKNTRMVSLVNCKGELSPNSNVARDRMEGGEKLNDVYKSVYDTYLDQIINQMNEMLDALSYSPTLNMAYNAIDKLTTNRGLSNTLADRDLFDTCLRSKDFFLIDNGNSWKLTSLDKLPPKIWSIDSRANFSAVNLLTEIKDSPKTPFQLIRELCKSPEYDTVNDVLVDPFSDHYLYRLFRRDYQITEIIFDKTKREFLFCWEKGKNPWYIVNFNRVNHITKLNQIYLQKTNEMVSFSPSESENIIVTQNNVYLIGQNKLFDYINTLYSTKSDDADAAFKIAVNFVVSFLFSDRKDKKLHFDVYFSSKDNYLEKDIWNFIDKDMFMEAFLNTDLKEINFNKYYGVENWFDYYET